jgi:hypothetical protein
MAQAGDIDRAVTIAHTISESDHESEALIAIVSAIAEAGDIDGAVIVAQSISDYYYQTKALAAIAEAAVERGHIARAVMIAEQITDSYYRTTVQIAVASALARVGDIDGAVNLAERVESSLRESGSEDDVVSVAEVLALAGQTHRVEEIACRVSPDEDRSAQLAQAAGQLASTGHRESAARVLARAWAGVEWSAPLKVLPSVDMWAARIIADAINRSPQPGYNGAPPTPESS